MMKVTYLVTVPPSVNAAYGNRRKGQRGRGRYKTPELQRWLQLAGAAIQSQGMVWFPCEVSVSIKAREPENNRCRDVDNVCKVALDLLVSLGVIVDDSRKIVKKVSAEWTHDESIAHGNIAIEVTEVECVAPKSVEKPKTERGKSWVVQQLKRKYGIDVAPERVHLQWK